MPKSAQSLNNLKINQAAKFLGVSAKTLRRWETSSVLTPKRTSGNQRVYPLGLLVDFKRLRSRSKRKYARAVKEIQHVLKAPKTQTSLKMTEKPIEGFGITSRQKLVLKGAFASLVLVFAVVALEKAGVFSMDDLIVKETEIGSKLVNFKERAGHVLSYVISPFTSKDRKVDQNIAFDQHGNILGVEDLQDAQFNVNIPANFSQDVVIEGNLTAPNITYSVTGGEGISVTGGQNPVVSLEADLLEVDAFGTVAVGSTNLVADGDSTLTFAGSSGISITANTINNTLTISASSSDLNISGWTDDGSTIRLSTIGDVVGIGTTSPNSKLQVDATSGDVFNVSNSDTSLFKVSSGGIVTLSSTGFLDLSSITHSTSAIQGLKLPQSTSLTNVISGEGYLAYDTDDNLIKLFDGSSWVNISGASTTLQQAYDNDVDGGDANITLNSTDDSILITNPAVGGTDSSFVLSIVQSAAGSIDALSISNSGSGAGINLNNSTLVNIGAAGTDFTSTGGLTLATGSLLDLSAIIHDTSTPQGFKLPQNTSLTSIVGGGEGFLAYDSDDKLVKVFDGTAWQNISGASTTLQQSYSNDSDGGDTIITLSSDDDSIIFRNPASGGTDTAYIFGLEQLANAAIDVLNITNSGTGAGINLNNSTIVNIGNAGTDFTSTGGLTLAGELVANGQVNLGDGGDTIAISGTTVSVTSSGAGNDVTITSADDIIFDDAQLTSPLQLTLTDTGLNAGLTQAIVDAINDIYDIATGGTGSSGFWQLNNNVISPTISSFDLAIGGTSTSSALFQVFGESGSATTSGVLTFGGATAQIQSTSNRPLLLGGDTTGSVLISPLNTTVATFTALGLDMNNLPITNIGNAGTDFDTNGGLTLAGDITINGGDLITGQSVFNLLDTTATTINFGGAATTLNIGATTGTTDVKNSLNVTGDLDIDGGDLTASTSSFNLLQSGVTTLNIGGAATTISIGNSSGTLTLNNATTVVSGNLDVNGTINDIAGTLNLSGNTLSSSGDLVIDPAGGGVKIGTGTPSIIDMEGDDLFVTDDLEVGGTIYGSLSGGVNPGFTQGSVVFAGPTGALSQDNSNFFWDDTENLLGLGTATPHSRLHVSGAVTGKALVTLDETGDQAILVASASGVNVATLERSGNLRIEGSISDLTDSTLTVDDSLLITGNTLSSSQVSFNLLNSTTETINFGGVATTINIGALTGITTVRNDLAITGNLDANGTSNDIAGTLNLSGNTLTSSGDLVIDPVGGGVKIGTGTPNQVDLAGDDLYVTGDLEVDGVLFADGGIDTAFTAGSIVFAGTNGVLAQDNASLFFDDNNNLLGLGTATPHSKLHVEGAVVGKALVTLDETGDQAILVASASGTNVFALDRTGNITAGTYNGNTITSGTGTLTLGTSTLTVSGTSNIDQDVRISSSPTFVGLTLSGLTSGAVYSNSGIISSEAQLAITRGGTNSTATPTLGQVAYGTGTAYAFTSGGSTGNVLSYNAGGAPTWIDASSVGTNYWQLSSNVLAPGGDALVTDRLVLGGQTSTVHQFEVNGAVVGKALVSLNETGDQAILVASASGTNVFVLDRTGDLAIEGSLSNLSGATLNINDNLSIVNSGTITNSGGLTLRTTSGNLLLDTATSGNVIIGPDISLGTGDDLFFQDGTLSAPIPLTIADTALNASLTQAMVDAINDVYDIATGGTGSSGFWQLTGEVVSPTISSYDLAIGGISTDSAKFQIFGESGNATTSGTFTFNAGNQIQTTSLETLTIGGDTTGNINLTALNGGGFVNITGNSILSTSAFRLTTGASSGYILVSDGDGDGTWTDLSTSGSIGPWSLSGSTLYPDLASYNLLIGSTNTADDIGKLTVSGAKVGKALVVLNETGDQDILTASASGVTVFTLDRSGNMITVDNAWIGLGAGAGRIEFDDQGTDEINFLNASVGIGTNAPDAALEINHATGNNLRLTYNDSDGSATNYTSFTLASNGGLTIDSSGNSISLGTNDLFTIPGVEGSNALTITAGDAVISDGSLLITDDDNAVSFGITNNTATTIGAGVNTAGIVDFSSTSLTTGNLLNLETTTTLTSGRVLNVSSTSTALTSGSLGVFDWSPGSATTATGDLLRIRIGPNGSTSGTLFNILDDTTSLFSVTESQITSNLPHAFTGAGDVTIANDLNFTNTTAAYINFTGGPGYIRTTHPSGNYDLVLSAANQGDVYIADSAVIEGAQIGRALLVLNETGDQAILTASASGVTQFTISRTGDMTLAGGDITGANGAAIDIGEATSGDVEITGDLLPSADATYDLGSTAKSWRNAYFTGDICFDDTDCASSWASVGTNYWQLNSNVLAPGGDALVTDRLVLGGQTSTVHQFEVNGAVVGKALVSLNETGDQNILTASASGVTVFNLTRTGDLQIEGSISDLGGTTLLVNDNLEVNGTSGITVSGNDADLTFSGTGNHDITAGAGTLRFGAATLTGTIAGGNQNIDDLGSLDFGSGNVNITGTTIGLTSDTDLLSLANNQLTINGDLVLTGGDITGANGAAIDIGEATSGDVEITGDLLPSADATYDLGSTDKSWRNLFLTGTLCFDDVDCIDEWADVSGGTNYWQLASNVLAPGGGAAVTDRLVLGGQTSTVHQFEVNGAVVGKALVSLNETGDQAILVASASGTNVFTLGRTGNLTLINSGTSNIDFNLSSSGDFTISDNGTPFVTFTDGGVVTIDSLNFDGTTIGLTSDTDLLSLSNNELTINGSAIITTDLAVNGGDITSSATSFNLLNTTVETLNIGGAATAISMGAGTGTTTVNNNFVSNGTITASTLDTAGGIVYTNGSGVLGTSSQGITGQVLLSGGTGAPTWADASSVGTNYWQLNSNVLAPGGGATVTDRLVLGGQTSTVHQFEVNGAVVGKALVSLNETGDQAILTASASGTTRFTLNRDGSIIQVAGTSTGTGYSMALNSLTSGTGQLLSSSTLTTGNLLNLTSTSTALTSGSLANLDWSPGGAATANGDLFRLNMGPNGSTTGNLFNITLDGSSIFRVSQSQIESALPHSFIAAGDVTMAYDLQFTNQTASYIKSKAPLYIDVGETYESNSLTFQTYNSGRILGDVTNDGGLTISSNVSGTTPQGLLQIEGASTGKALAILNETGDQNILTASASGTTMLTLSRTGALTLNSSTGLLDLSAITHSTTAISGLKLPQADLGANGPSVGSGFLAFDTGDNQVKAWYGGSWNSIAGASTTLQQAYEAGNTIDITSGEGALIIDAQTANIDFKIGEGSDTGDFRIWDGTNNWFLVDEDISTVAIGNSAGNTALTLNSGGTGDITINSSDTLLLDAAGVVEINSSAGAINIGNDAVAQAINIGTGAAARTITIGNNTGATALNFTSGTGSQTFTSNVATGTTTTSGFVFDATAITSGTGLYLTSDSLVNGILANIATTGNTLTTGTLLSVGSTATSLTSGTLGNFDWSPSSWATASGDLVKISIGQYGDTTGNLFNILDNNSSLFSVSTTAVTSNLPVAFNAAGDVSVAYDLLFTNQTASYIKSNAPLYIEAGESFENNNLTLKTFGTGQIITEGSFNGTNITSRDDETGASTNTVTGRGMVYYLHADSNTTNSSFTTTYNITGVPDTYGTILFINSVAEKGATGGAQTHTVAVQINGTQVSTVATANDTAASTVKESYTIVRNYDGWKIVGATGTADSADYAEVYRAEANVESGEVVAISNINTITVGRATTQNLDKVIGVTSTSPAFVIGEEFGNDEKKLPVALAGRVPVKVSDFSPPISIGDTLTVSPTEPGKATKATRPGRTIGKALEPWTPGGKEKVLIFVENTWSDPKSSLAFDGAGNLVLSQATLNSINVPDYSNQLALLDQRISSLENTQIQGLGLLQNQIDVLTSRVDLLESEINLLKTATGSGQLVQEATSSGTFNSLFVLDDTVLGDTVINGRLDIGTLSFDNADNSINAPGTLNLQPLALGNVQLLGGLIEFDTDGNITIAQGVIKGNDSFRGTVELGVDEYEVQVLGAWTEAPVTVNVTPTYRTNVWVTNITENGFTINVSSSPTVTKEIFWSAIW